MTWSITDECNQCNILYIQMQMQLPYLIGSNAEKILQRYGLLVGIEHTPLRLSCNGIVQLAEHLT